MDHVGAVVVAAGRGERMGTPQRKQFMPLAGRALLSRALEPFLNFPGVDLVAIVAAAGEEERCRREIVEPLCPAKPCRVVTGGERRQDSVRGGLRALPPSVELVIIHDGARPLLSLELLERVLEAAREYGAAVAALPVTDTVKIAREGDWVLSTPSREMLWAAQTPQAFRRDILEEAYLKADQVGLEATDDASLVEAMGQAVKLVPGERRNLKVTTPLDLLLAEAILNSRR